MTENNGQAVHPIDAEQDHHAPHLTIDSYYKADDGSEWLWNGAGYTQIVEPWAVESHISPIRAAEKLGSIESWVQYVAKYGDADTTLLTWSDQRLRGVLDYHSDQHAPGRGAWTAEHPLERTRQWLAWQRIANGSAIGQKALIEALEDHRQDIQDPDAATMVGLIRSLRANVNVAAESELETNGNTKLSFSRQTTTSVELPPSLTIGIPVLKGHTAPDGNGVEGPVRYAIEVLIRVDVLDGGKLAFRLSMPNADQALEDAVADRVREAEELLPDDFLLLRSTAS